MSHSDWLKTYKEVSGTRPQIGANIRTMSGLPIRINIQLKTGRTPFLYAMLHVPCLIGQPIGWFARDIADNKNHGTKAILMPRARDLILTHPRFNPDSTWIGVDEIRIVRIPDLFHVEISDLGNWLDKNHAHKDSAHGSVPQSTGESGA